MSRMSEFHAEQCQQQEDQAFERHCAEVDYAQWLADPEQQTEYQNYLNKENQNEHKSS